MTEQQQHLQSAIQQQNTLLNEIQSLQQQIDNKRQLAVKAQGIIEYLDQIGVKLPEPETTASPEETEEVETSDTQVVTE
jgi:hypothetical protein|tara:strand:- start:3227 stop:3463 length:237 start_codon:yes stop_codon:yes gene_type:complete